MESWVRQLLIWYYEEKRDLPWRENKDPYRIWLSEIMLQQTKVITVKAYFKRFTERFESVDTLASASEDEVLKLWEGLGYYTRARNLIKCARIVGEVYDGKFPETYKALLQLPGIGPYTAGAIASIAYDERVPAVDGNVMRVIARYFQLDYDLSASRTTRRFFDLLLPYIPEEAGDFNQALMELGATICIPKQPLCSMCPLVGDCKAFRTGTVLSYPVKSKRIHQKPVPICMAQIFVKDKRLLTRQVEEKLLQGLWVLPYEEMMPDQKLFRRKLEEAYSITLDEGYVTGHYVHIYTHLKWQITLYVFEATKAYEIDFPEVKWVTEQERKLLALPKVVQKAFDIGSTRKDVQ